MLDRLKAWLRGAEGPAPSRLTHDKRQRAAAALLVEAAHLDGHYGADERAHIQALLAERFGLKPEEAAALTEAGEGAQAEAVDLFRFTRNAAMEQSEAERIRLIEMLWEVVYADGVEHPYESNLMRRVTGLLHLSDQQSGAARQRVLARLRREAEAEKKGSQGA